MAQAPPRFRFSEREQPIRWPDVLRVDIAKLQALNPVPPAELRLLDETARVVSDFNFVPDANAPPTDELQKFVTLSKVRQQAQLTVMQALHLHNTSSVLLRGN